MSTNARTDVLTAYELLLEALQAETAQINCEGGAALTAGKLKQAQEMIQRSTRLGEVRAQLEALGKQLHELLPKPQPDIPQGAGRLTPDEAYALPILRALAAAGGSARRRDVHAAVYAEMAPRLTPRDHEPRKSPPHEPAWQNNIDWCRNALREKGLLKSGSKPGVWEITEAGKEWLAKQEPQSDS